MVVLASPYRAMHAYVASRIRVRTGCSTGAGLQVEIGVEADRDAWMVGDALDRQQHAGHERRTVIRVVADRQGLSGGAEQNLLMGDHAPHTHRVDVNSCRANGSARVLEVGNARRIRGPLRRGSSQSRGGMDRRTRWRVGLAIVMQLDDLC